jgi:hypothetical protein
MRLRIVAITLALLCGCDDDDEPASWQVVGRGLPSALVSVWGTGPSDVFTVGGDRGDGAGPIVMHYDGASWTRLATGEVGNLWWVYGFADGPVYMGGDGGMILRYQNGAFTRMTTPGTDTIFGIWGASSGDVWAVGGPLASSTGGFAWRLQGETWTVAPLPAEVSANAVIWKMYGRTADDAWMVGTSGQTVRWDGAALTPVNAGTGESLFTVHADAQRFVAVGGAGTGSIIESDGGTTWRNVSPGAAPGLIGVCLTPDGGFAVGQFGAVYKRTSSGWTEEKTQLQIDESFHSVWEDGDGGVWLVGGDVLSLPLTAGIMVYRGPQSVAGGIQ